MKAFVFGFRKGLKKKKWQFVQPHTWALFGSPVQTARCGLVQNKWEVFMHTPLWFIILYGMVKDSVVKLAVIVYLSKSDDVHGFNKQQHLYMYM